MYWQNWGTHSKKSQLTYKCLTQRILQIPSLRQRLVHFTSGENASSCLSRTGWRKHLKYILSANYEESCFLLWTRLKATQRQLKKILKDDYQLFSRLFISYQNKQCDLQEIFKHESQTTLAWFGSGGQIHICRKSQLTELLQAQVAIPDKEPGGRHNHNRNLSTNPGPMNPFIETKSKTRKFCYMSRCLYKMSQFMVHIFSKINLVLTFFYSLKVKAPKRSTAHRSHFKRFMFQRNFGWTCLKYD